MVPDTKRFVDVAPECYVAAALMLLLVPLPWICAWVTAVVVHEAFHLLALRACGIFAERIHIGLTGARIQTSTLEPAVHLFCILAGPCGALLLLLFKASFPRLAVCVMVQSLYNLLPVLPLDGGHALECVLSIFLPEMVVNKFFLWEGRAIRCVMLMLSVMAVIYLQSWLFLFVFLIYMGVRYMKIKYSCKSVSHRVQ